MDIWDRSPVVLVFDSTAFVSPKNIIVGNREIMREIWESVNDIIEIEKKKIIIEYYLLSDELKGDRTKKIAKR
jgi:hypothetical protein